MGDTATSTAIATVIATIITAGAALVTQRSAARAAVRNQETSSRTDIEREAFARAQGFYTDTIDRQQREIVALETDVDRLKSRVAELETKLSTAEAALRLRFPDEP